MDFNFNEEQQMVYDSTKKFFEKETSGTLLRELMEDDKGYSPEVWKKMAELGWMGLLFKEEYGGFEGSFLDFALILEGMGKSAMPSPFLSTVILTGLIIQDNGSEELKKEYLPKIAEGECISTLAFLGRKGLYSKSELELEAKQVNGGYRISGAASFVPYAHVADNILCAAKTTDSEGVTLFILDGKAAGIETINLHSISGKGVDCLVNFRDVQATPAQIVGEAGKGWEYIEAQWPKVAVALSCECVGGMDRVMELALNHVNERIQFGKPLSALQVVQHMCVDMAMKLETSRHTAHYAAWQINEGLDCTKEAAIAKSWCGEAFKMVTKIGHQLTGGIGFSKEFDLFLYTRNAKKLELLFGDGSFQRAIVADNIGL